jgi:hypothetical protein
MVTRLKINITITTGLMYAGVLTVSNFKATHVKNAQVVTGLQTSCYKSVHKLSTSCVRTACSQLLEQVWNKLLTTCNKLA